MSHKKKGKKQKPSRTLDIDRAIHSALKYHESGRLDKAERIYRKILKNYPDQPDALHFLGLIAGQLGKIDEADALMLKAIRVLPRHAVFHHNYGTALKEQGRWREAIRYYENAVALEPGYLEAHYNMGEAYLNQGNPSKAFSCFKQALDLKSDFPEAYNQMGNALQDMGKLEEAIDSYRKVLRSEPLLPEAYCQLLFLLKQTCSWKEMEDLETEIRSLIDRSPLLRTEDFESPFVSVAMYPDPERNFTVARIWSSNISEEVTKFRPSFTFENRGRPKDKIIVGYLSSDFHDHATAHLMLSLFGLHDRTAFEIHCYSYGEDDGSTYRKRIREDSDRFIDVSDLGCAAIAKRIYEGEVDILIDLKGYTTGGRMHISAFRPAPVQVSYLGFPGTTGAEFIDYIITDRIVTPKSQSSCYSEKCVYLPHCYQVNDNAQTISKKEWTKSHFGLPEDGIVFCSFNQGYKIDPPMFDVWMRILRDVPESVLWLLVKGEIVKRNLRQEAEHRGVDAHRLHFAERLPKPDHLARLALADLALDTRIYNGHTTSSDALWAGVPVITVQGNHFASRVSSSILTASGLPELITNSLEEYRNLAVRLAQGLDQREAVRRKLIGNRSARPLFDTPRFVRNLEKAYKAMWDIFSSGEDVRTIEVVED